MARRRIANVEDVPEVVIGSAYMVNAVVRTRDNAIIPVHGPLHEDRALLKFPDDHWHIDWRFLGKRSYAALEAWSMGFSMPWGQPISLQNTTGTVTRRRMICLRQFGDYPPIARIKGFPALQDKYRNAKMKNLICPHRGIPCNATPTKDGVVICRGHGLAFNVETGALVLQDTATASPVRVPQQRKMFR